MAASSDIAEIYNKTLLTNQLLVTLATVWVWGECTEVSARVLQCVIKTAFYFLNPDLFYSHVNTRTYTSACNTINNFMCITKYVIFFSTYPIIHLFLHPSMLQS
jgi:hypothetical protein